MVELRYNSDGMLEGIISFPDDDLFSPFDEDFEGIWGDDYPEAYS